MPSGDAASAATGASWPSPPGPITRTGLSEPARQSATRPSWPPVAKRPPGSAMAAFTALSCRRSTAIASPRSSDQRIARLSKLPEIAMAPSPATESARTGPP